MALPITTNNEENRMTLQQKAIEQSLNPGKDDKRVIFRRAGEEDLISLNQTLRSSKAYWGYDQEFMDAFMEKFGLSEQYLQDNIVYLMSQSSRDIGYFSFIFHEEHSLELDHFFISPEYIGKGFGRKMWEACCEVAQELHVEEFTLWADPEAEGFYSKVGCRKIGVKKSPFMPNRYPPIMSFKLINK